MSESATAEGTTESATSRAREEPGGSGRPADADAHRNSLEKIFPRLGETGTTEAVRTLLG